MKVEMSQKNGNQKHARIVIDGQTFWIGKPNEDPNLIARALSKLEGNPKNASELQRILAENGFEIQPVTDPVPGSEERKPRIDPISKQVVLMICRSGWVDWAE